MKTTANIVLMILAFLSFVSPTWARQGENAFFADDESNKNQDQVKLQGESGDFYVTITKTFDVGQGGTLQVDRLSGDFVVNTWDKDQVDIRNEMHIRSFTRGEAEEVFRRAHAGIELVGNTVRISGSGEGVSVSNSLTISLPKRFNVRIDTFGGDIDLTGVEGEIELKTRGGDIQIAETAGRTHVATSGGDLSFTKVSGEIDGNTSGGDITLNQIFGRGHFNTSGGDIYLDESTNDISLNTSGGEIQVHHARATVSANTSGGDIEVIECEGRCSVNTSGGDIRLEKIKGELSAGTSGGDISGFDFGEKISVNTSGGDIRLENVRASAICKTSGGDVEVELTLTDFSAKHAVDIQTSGGKITLTIPAKLPATVTAVIHTNRRNYKLERYDIFSDFPLTKTKPEEGEDVLIYSKGDINGGGDPIHLETTNGDIYLKKAE